MSELPDRVVRAFRDHGSFERVGETTFESTSTPFTGHVEVSPAEGGRFQYQVAVRVPMLDETTEDSVADVVEEGWYETFELRVEDVSGVTEAKRDVSPTVRVGTSDGRREAVVEASFEDINPDRAVNDAAAVIDYVEGTFVEGIIPGYEYTEPASSLINRARQTGGDEGSGGAGPA